MTHQNHQTNGGSLEDCHTNFFALTDLCGIKWRRLVQGERPNASGDPLDDPVLRSYSRCLAVDILCVWRRVAAPKPDPDPSGNLYDISLTGPNTGTVTHPPLSLSAAKELWIFWYGEEPDLSELVSPELLKSSEGSEQSSGSWEVGLSYECRSLLFKALHNLIERCLLSRDVVRIGRWFVQPCSSNERIFGKSSHHLSFSFAFFVHGDNTVCASMDLREHPPVRPLSPEYLAEAAAQSNNNEAQPKHVLLAPFGLAATLTGQSYRVLDPTTQKSFEEWCAFYPLCNRDNSDLPPFVEVISGGVKMRYPSKYILITDLDDAKSGITTNDKTSPQTDSIAVENNLGHPSSMHLPASISTKLPERVWQDCLLNSANINQTSVNLQKDSSNEQNLSSGNINNNEPNSIWDFTDPTHKTSCVCIKCRKLSGRSTTGGKSSSRSEKGNRQIRIPFHKRLSNGQQLSNKNCTSNQTTKTATGQPQAATTANTTCTSTISVTTSTSNNTIENNFTSTSSSSQRNSAGTPCYSRNQNESLPVPSVGSPASPAQSPMANTSLSQPTSVPSADQLLSILSPIQPQSAPNIQPTTPMEHIDKNTPAPTPTDQHDSKSTTASPYPQTGGASSVEPPIIQSEQINNKLKSEPGQSEKCVNSQNQSGSSVSVSSGNSTNLIINPSTSKSVNNNLNNHSLISSLKRPVLSSNDYENIIDDDCLSQQLLYDYSMWDAWMNHPIKRYKPNEDTKYNIKKTTYSSDLYAAEKTSQPFQEYLTSTMSSLALSEQNIKMDSGQNDMLQANEIKQEPGAEGADGKDKFGTNLFTSEGLQASYKDLEQIFDNSDDTSSDEALQVHTPPNSNKSSGGTEDSQKKNIGSGNPNMPIRPEELSKMFPTPPSLEHHPNSSPCGAGLCDAPMTDLIKQEIYPNLGSPANEPVDDWSFVFTPPKHFKFVGSTKYAPLTNLPSQSLPPIHLPTNAIYNPSWKNKNSKRNINNNVQREEKLQIRQVPLATTTTVAAAAAAAASQQQQHQQQQLHQNFNHSFPTTPRPSSAVSIPGCNSNSMNMGGIPQFQNNMLRPGMSPISPANSVPPYSVGSPMHYRRTPLPPPPPYDLAIASPANSTCSLKQFNSNEPETPSAYQRAPEANSLLVNILLCDTALNIFRDHNFDSCTLCVCNAGLKCVGNIRGADSGVYLALPGSNNFNYQSQNSYSGGSAFGMDSPAGYPNQNGYLDEDPINCRCGFSAVVNRRLSHRSGLFYEDEMEITGMAEDPANYKKNSLMSYILGDKKIKLENSEQCDIVQQQIVDLLREQLVVVQSSSNSVQRMLREFVSKTTAESSRNKTVHLLEYIDAHDVINLVLEQSRLAYEMSMCKMELDNYRPIKANISVHKWPYVKAGGPRSNQDIIRIMKSIQPLLQDAFHKKSTTRLWEAPYTVQGPLTWRQFHRMAAKGTTGQCEPQPIPTVIVGHEKDWLSVAPYAIHYWDKLLLEPYSYSRDVVYIVIAPDSDDICKMIKMYFKELSTTYEMCKLGKHTPIKGWDGILRVNKTMQQNSEQIDEWFSMLGDSKTSEMLKLYAHALQNHLVPYLTKIPLDKSLLDPPDSSNISFNQNINRDRSLPSPMPPPSTPDPSQNEQKPLLTPKIETDPENSQHETLNTSATPITEPLSASDDEEKDPPCIVIYVVEPFTCGSDSPDLQRLACLALLRSYSCILNSVPDSVRVNINFQIISLESIMELGCNRNRIRLGDEMRCLAMSVFSQCRRYLAHTNNIKSLTGFGTAADSEQFLKTKDERNRNAYRLYTPPYILSAQHEKKSENSENFGNSNIEQQCSVMYCSYCLSEDQSWLLAVATDDRGELLETVTINIDIPNRTRRKKASARRLGLQKLMDFILGVISQSVQPWHIVIGRIGRIGHGELKGWSWLLSKSNLLKASKQLKDICKQCSLMYPHAVPSILSACLVTLEPDSNLRVMPDQFTPDERFSQISMQSPLSTPQDVSSTHILVFPTSAITQSSQTAFQEQHINGLELDEELFIELGDEEGMDGMEGMNGLDLFGEWDDVPMQQPSPERNSRLGSPNGMEDNRSRQSPIPDGINCGSNRNGHMNDTEEVGQLLQQPLALGYLVSTAPTGRMPSWFWSSCPHLENVCPVFLKTALHLHSSSIQQCTDDILQQNQSSGPDHPLNSQLTADVLRYVLEGYNVLSWLAMDSNTQDRLSCLPIHVQVLMQLYHMTAALT